MKITLLVTDFDNVDIEAEVDLEDGDTLRVYFDREKDEVDWEIL